MEKTFKVGDSVVVTDAGEKYSTFFEKFHEMGFRNPDSVKDVPRDFAQQDELFPIPPGVFTVFATGSHLRDGEVKNLVAIENIEGDQYLFDPNGLELA
jgi:hypothetical protein